MRNSLATIWNISSYLLQLCKVGNLSVSCRRLLNIAMKGPAWRNRNEVMGIPVKASYLWDKKFHHRLHEMIFLMFDVNVTVVGVCIINTDCLKYLAFSKGMLGLLRWCGFSGGLSLHLNHLIASCMTNYDWPFGTLPFGLFGSNLDTRDLETYPRTYSGHCWNMSLFGNSRAIWVLFRKWVVSENQSFLDEGVIITPLSV